MENPNKIQPETIGNKQAGVEQATQLKAALLNAQSQQKQASVDPQVSFQQDLQQLSPNQFLAKHGFSDEARKAVIAKTFGKATQEHQQQELENTAEDYSLGEVALDAGLGIAATGTAILADTPATIMAVGAEPEEAIVSGASKIAGTVADFFGGDGAEVEASISEFIDDTKENLQDTYLGEVAQELEQTPAIKAVRAFSEGKAELLQDAAGLIFETSGTVKEWIRSGQSEALNARAALRQQEHEAYKQELNEKLGEDASIWEHATKNTKLGGKALWELAKDPKSASVAIIESAPYLLTSAGAAKAASKKVFAKEQQNIADKIHAMAGPHKDIKESINKVLKSKAEEITKAQQVAGGKAALNTGSLLEASGSASEAYEVIMNAPIESLTKTSERFNELTKTMTPEEAQKKLAIEGAVGAGSAMLVTAYAIGRVLRIGDSVNRIGGVTKTADGTVPAAVQYTADVLKEGVEEGLQSFSSAVYTGQLEKEHVDSSKDVYGDAAIAAGEGALAGMGTSGGLQGIRHFKDAVANATKNVVKKGTSTRKAKDVRENGLTEADTNPDQMNFDYTGIMKGITQRNLKEDVTPEEKVNNFNEARNITVKLMSQISVFKKALEEGEITDPTQRKNVETYLEQAEKDLEEGKQVLKKMQFQNKQANRTQVKEDVAATVEGDTKAAERTMGSILSDPESVTGEQAQAMLDSGTLTPEQVTIVETHQKYVDTIKSIEEVSIDVLEGGTGFVGLRQYVDGVSAAVGLGKMQEALVHLSGLNTFAKRHRVKANEFNEAMTIHALGNKATPAQKERLSELQQKYRTTDGTPYSFSRNAQRITKQITEEAYALEQGLKLAGQMIFQTSKQAQTAAPTVTPSNESTTETNVPEASTETQETVQTAPEETIWIEWDQGKEGAPAPTATDVIQAYGIDNPTPEQQQAAEALNAHQQVDYTLDPRVNSDLTDQDIESLREVLSTSTKTPETQTQKEIETRLNEVEERQREIEIESNEQQYTEDTIPQELAEEGEALYVEQQQLLEQVEETPTQTTGETQATAQAETTVEAQEQVAQSEPVSQEDVSKDSVETLTDIYNTSTELQNLGTLNEYISYVLSIFPDSVIKDVVYHGSGRSFEQFDSKFAGESTGGGEYEGQDGGTGVLQDSNYAIFFSQDEVNTTQYSLIEQVNNLHLVQGFIVTIRNAVYDRKDATTLIAELNEFAPFFGKQVEDLINSDTPRKEKIATLNSMDKRLGELRSIGLLNTAQNLRLSKKLLDRVLKEASDFSGGTFSSPKDIYLYDKEKKGLVTVILKDGVIEGDTPYNGKNITELSPSEIQEFTTKALLNLQKFLDEHQQDIEEANYTPNTYPTVINITNPAIKDFKGVAFVAQATDVDSVAYEASVFTKEAVEAGNDGVVFENIRDPNLADNYGVFDAKNTHILGTPIDIQGFAEFKSQAPVTQKAPIQEEVVQELDNEASPQQELFTEGQPPVFSTALQELEEAGEEGATQLEQEEAGQQRLELFNLSANLTGSASVVEQVQPESSTVGVDEEGYSIVTKPATQVLNEVLESDIYEYTTIIDAVLAVVPKDATINFVSHDHPKLTNQQGTMDGMYYSDGDIIYISNALKPGSIEYSNLVLRESIHAITFNLLNGQVKNPTPAQIAFVNEVTEIYRQAKNQVKLSELTPFERYGFTNVHEFVSESLTSPTFQRLLSTLVTRKKVSVFTSFMQALKNMFGIPVSINTHLARILDASQTFLEAEANTEVAVKSKAQAQSDFTKDNLVQKYFEPANNNGLTLNPLIVEQDLATLLKESPEEMIRKYTGSTATPKQIRLMQELSQHIADFKKYFDKTFVTKDKYKYQDMIQYLLDENGNMPDNVIIAMAIAQYNWLITDASASIYNNDDAIRRIARLGSDEYVTQDLREKLHEGTTRTRVIETIGSDVVRMLGIKTNPLSTPSNMKGNLQDSIGLHVTAVLKNMGLVSFKDVTFIETLEDGTTKPNKVPMVIAANEIVKDVKVPHEVIRDMINVSKDTNYILQNMFKATQRKKAPSLFKPKSVNTKVRNTNQTITDEARRAIDIHQQRKHFMKGVQVEKFLKLPIEAQREMLGYKDPKKVQAGLRKSQEGLNRDINLSIQYLMDMLEGNPDNKPFYFQHYVVKNGRIMINSNTFNPQSDKLHRHMMRIQGQEVTIDLTQDTSDNLDGFFMAVAQGLGIKVDKKLNADAIAELQDHMVTLYGDAIDVIRHSGSESFTEADSRIILDAIKEGGEKSWSFDALVAYAAFEDALGAGKSEFTHDLMLEADGVTNGPAIVTLQYGLGKDEADLTQRYKQIGINRNGDIQEYGEYAAEGNDDNYESVVSYVAEQVEGNVGPLLNLAKFLIPADRDLAKYPLMTFIYGASEAAIKKAVGYALLEKFYETLGSGNKAKIKETLELFDAQFDKDSKISTTATNVMELKFTKAEEAHIAKVLGNAYGSLLIRGIESRYGEFQDLAKVFNKAMGAVAENFNKIYQHAVKKRTEELVALGVLATSPKGRVLEALPQAEVDKILSDLIEAQPIIQSVLSAQAGDLTQHGIYVGKSEKVKQQDKAEYEIRAKYTDSDGVERGLTTFSSAIEYINGGVSPTVVGVQGIDAASMTRHLAEWASFNVHDAIITGTSNIIEHTKDINKQFADINMNYSLAEEFKKAFDRALEASKAYDQEHGTNFTKNLTDKKIKLSNGPNVFDTFNLQETLTTKTEEVLKSKEGNLAGITGWSQYYWQGARHNTSGEGLGNPLDNVNDNTVTDEDVLNSSPDDGTNQPKVTGRSHTEEQVNQMNAVQVFERLASFGNKVDSPQHTQALLDGIQVLSEQLTQPLKLVIDDVLGDSIGGITGNDIQLYTQMFGGQAESSAIANTSLRMSAQEVMAHELWHAVSRHGIEGNSRAKKELERFWHRAKQSITPFDLMDDPTLGANSPEYAEAKKTWDYIFTPRTAKVLEVDDPTGNKRPKKYANYLHEFAAYAMTNEKMQQALAAKVPNDFKDPLPKLNTDSVIDFGISLLDAIQSLFLNLVNNLSQHLTNTKTLRTDKAVQQLVKQLANIEMQNKNTLLNFLDSVDSAKGVLTGTLHSAALLTIKPLVALANAGFVKNSKSWAVRLGGNVLNFATSTERTGYVADYITKVTENWDNKRQGILGDLVTEAKGLTKNNKKFYTLSRLSRKAVDAMVVQMETNVAKVLDKMLPKMSENTSTSLTKGFLKTDLSSLNMSETVIQKLLADPKALEAEIQALETTLANKPHGDYFLVQSKALGYYMVTGKVTSQKMNFNALQIASLFGSTKTNPNPQNDLADIDTLTSLYALRYTGKDIKQSMSNFILENPDALESMMIIHRNQKETDAKKIFKNQEINVVKGYVKEQYDPNVAVKFASETEGKELEQRGWVKYSRELYSDKYAPVLPEKTFLYVNKHHRETSTLAGIISLNSLQAKGTTDSDIVFSIDPNNAKNPAIIRQRSAHLFANKSKAFNQQLAMGVNFDPTKADNGMAPLYDLNGNITGYRHMMLESTKDNLMGRDNDVIKAMAKGAASSVGKYNSQVMNNQAIEAMFEDYSKATNLDGYIEVGPNSSDPEILETYRKLPEHTKQHMENVWGTRTMYVKRDVFNTMFGYRKFALADMMEKSEHQKRIAIMALNGVMDFVAQPFGVTGSQAVRNIGNAWMDFVKWSKDIIVIKTGLVTLVNTLSNTAQLYTLGMSTLDILKYQREAFVEARRYRKDSADLFELEKLLEINTDPSREGALKSRIAQLEHNIATNPVTNLVEDGLLQAIVEDVGLIEDKFSSTNKFKAKVDPYVSRIPGFVRAGANVLTMGHDTKLYKFMSDAAQLSDFVARYALYKHNTLVADNVLSHEDAVNTSMDTFVNYDLPTNKFIQYFNDLGFAWFTKYYVRIQKILFKNLRSNPARVLGLLTMDWMTGDGVSTVYDSYLSPENIANRLMTPELPYNSLGDMFTFDMIGKVI